MKTEDTSSTLTIVIPCFNEAGSLPELVARCKRISRDHLVDFIFVDNGSVDSTPIVLTELVRDAPRISIITILENRGYGGGIIAGLLAAKTEFVGWTHADLQSDPEDIINAMVLLDATPIRDGVFIKGRRRNRALASVFFTFGMSVFETLLFRMHLYDINAQPTIIRRDFLKAWQKAPTDFSFDLYVYVMARKRRIEVKRFEVWFKDREFGESKWNTTWRSRWIFVARIFRYSLVLRRDIDNVSQ